MPPSRFYKLTFLYKEKPYYSALPEKEYRCLSLHPSWKSGDFLELSQTEAWRDMEQLFIRKNLNIKTLPPFSGLHVPAWMKAEKDKKGKTIYKDRKNNRIVEKQLICLRELNCAGSSLEVLPALPEGLEALIVCSMPNLRKLPRLPSTLKLLDIRDTPLTELPKLPEGLKELHGAECLPKKFRRDFVLFRDRSHVREYFEDDNDPDISAGLCEAHKAQGYKYILLDSLWHYIHYHNERLRANKRAARIKKQLVENVFHPRRVWKWIEQGLEVEDM